MCSRISRGSVNQKIVPYAVRENVFLIAGFNLPLLVALAIAPQGITREDVRQYIEDSKNRWNWWSWKRMTAGMRISLRRR